MSLSRLVTRYYGDVIVAGHPVLTTAEEDQVTIVNPTPSYSPDTGSLVLTGGMGIQGSLYIKGELVPIGGIDASNGQIRNLSDPSMPGDAVTLSYFLQNAGGIRAGTGIVKDVNTIHVSSNLSHVSTLGTIVGGRWEAQLIGTKWGGTGRDAFPDGQILFGGGAGAALSSDPTFRFDTTTKTLTLLGLNDALDSTSASLVLSGGAAVQKRIYCKGGITSDGPVLMTSNNDEVLRVIGGASVGGLLQLGSGLTTAGRTETRRLSVTDTADADSPAIAPAAFACGIGVQGKSVFGQTLQVNGSLFAASPQEATGVGVASIICNGGISTRLSAIIGADLTVNGNANFRTLAATAQITAPTISLTSTQESLGLGSGSFSTAGGLSARRASFFGSDVRVVGRLSIDSPQDAIESQPDSGGLVVTGGAHVHGKTVFESDVSVKGKMQFAGNLGFEYLTLTADVESTTLGTGTCVVQGGASVSRTLRAASIVSHAAIESISPGTGAVVVSSGGFGCFGNGHFGGRVVAGSGEDAIAPGQGGITTPGGISAGRTIRGEADLWVGGTGRMSALSTTELIVTGTADAPEVGQGPIRCQGGASIRLTLRVGEDISCAGVGVFQRGLSSNGPTTLAGNTSIGQVLKVQGDSTFASAVSAKSLSVTELSTVTDLNVVGRVQFQNTDDVDQPASASFGGGLRVAKSLSVGGVTALSRTTVATMTVTSADDATSLLNSPFTAVGGCAVRKRLFVGGLATFASPVAIVESGSPTPATRLGEGCLVLGGGLSAAGQSIFGSSISVLGEATFREKVSTTASLEARAGFTSSSVGDAGSALPSGEFLGGIRVAKDALVGTTLTVGGVTNLRGPVTLSSGLAVADQTVLGSAVVSLSPTSGGTVVMGGLGCAKNAMIAGPLTVFSNSTFDKNLTVRSTADDALNVLGQVVADRLLVGGSARVLGPTSLVGDARVEGTLSAALVRVTDTSTNAFQVAGGLRSGGTVSALSLSTNELVAAERISGKSVSCGDLTVNSPDVDATSIGTGALKVFGGFSASRTIQGGSLRVAGASVLSAVSATSSVTSYLTVTDPVDLDMPSATAPLTCLGGALISKSVSIGGSLILSGSFAVGDEADVTANGAAASAVFRGGVAVRKGLHVTGRIAGAGAATFQSSVGCASLSVSNDAQILGAASVGALTCGDRATVAGMLSATAFAVTGLAADSATFAGGIAVRGPANIDGSLAASGVTINGLATLNGAVVASGACVFTNPTDASMSAAAVQVSGGLSVLKNARFGAGMVVTSDAFFGGHVTVSSPEDSADDPSAGGLRLLGGLGMQGSLTCNGKAYINAGATVRGPILATSTLDVTPAGAASLACAGGLFVNQSARVGRNLFVGQSLQVTSTSSFSSPVRILSVAALDAATGPALDVAGAQRVQGDLQVDGTLKCGAFNVAQALSVTTLRTTDTGAWSPTSSGVTSLVSDGGFYCAKDAGFGSSIYVARNSVVSGDSAVGGRAEIAGKCAIADPTDAAAGGALSVLGGGRFGKDLVVGSTVTAVDYVATGSLAAGAARVQTIQVASTQEASDLFTGCLQAFGGAAIRGSLFVGSAFRVFGAASVAGPIACQAGASVAGTLSTGTAGGVVGLRCTGDAVISGNAQFQGSLEVTGQATFRSAIFASDQGYTFPRITVNGNVTATGDIVSSAGVEAAVGRVSGELRAGTITAGAGTLASLVTTGSIQSGTSCAVTGTLTVGGAATFNSLVSAPAGLLAKSLNITDTGDGAMRCAGSFSLSGPLTTGSSARVGGFLGLATNTKYVPTTHGRGSCLNVFDGMVVDVESRGGSIVDTVGVAYFGRTQFSSAEVGTTLSTAATILVGGAPSAGVNRLVNDAYAVLVESGKVRFMDPSESDGPQSGSLRVDGGMGVLGRLHGGSSATFVGDVRSAAEVRALTVRATSTVGDCAVFEADVRCAGTVRAAKCAVADEVFASRVVCTDTTNATAPDDAPALVAGGLGVGKDVHVAGSVRCASVALSAGLSASSASVSTVSVGAGADDALAVVGGIVARRCTLSQDISCGGDANLNTATFRGNVAFVSGTEATSVSTANVTISGGAGVSGTIHAGALQVQGSLKVGGSATFDKSVNVTGYFITTPLSGDTLTLTASHPYYIVMPPAGNLTIFTVVFPNALDGHILTLTTTKDIMQLITTNATFAPGMAPAAQLSAGQVLRYIYIAELALWFRR